MEKILVIQTAFIGDAILATSLLESLHFRFPQSRIDLMLRKGNEGLFDCHPFLGKLWVWDKKQSKYGNLINLLGAIRKERYDLLINLQRFATTGIFTILSGAAITRGFRKNPFSWAFSKSLPHSIGDGTHETVRNHRLLEGIVDEPASRPKLHLNESHIGKVEEFQHAPYITFAPASVWFTKQFPEEKWAEALNEVPDDLRIIALGAPADREIAQRILDSLSCESGLNLCGELSLLESAALMKGAAMNFVNDSAPLHLASAVDAPVSAIFCSTVPEFGFGPLSEQRNIIQLNQNLECRPCGIHGFRKCPKGHFHCALNIDPEQFRQIFNRL